MRKITTILLGGATIAVAATLLLMPTDQPGHTLLNGTKAQTPATRIVASIQPRIPPMRETLLALLAENDPTLRSEAIGAAITRTTDPASTLRELAAAGDAPAVAEFRQRLMRHWATASPKEAAAFANTIEQPGARAELYEQVAIAWASGDLAAAVSWADTLTAEPARPVVLAALSTEAARSDAMLALRLAEQMPGGPSRIAALEHALSQLSSTQPQAAAAAAMRLQMPTLAGSVASVWAGTDPMEAACFVADQPESAAKNLAAVAVARRWAQRAPGEAAAWIDAFPKGTTRSAAMEALLSTWVTSNATAAQHWVESQPAGALRDEALALFAQSIAEKDAALARSLLARIGDAALRQRSEAVLSRIK